MFTSSADRSRRRFLKTGARGALGAALLSLAACDSLDPLTEDETTNSPAEGIPSEQLREGCPGGKDCIPAITNPETSPVSEIEFLKPSSRIISLQLGETWIAVPHNILWWHEIANFNRRPGPVAVTLCPLTGSSLTFRRKKVDGAEFGVSGLLFKNNLVMYDRRENDSLWPQMMRKAGQGPETGTTLSMYSSVVMDWAGFRRLHPDGQVVNRNTGYARDYERYPYGDRYDDPQSEELLFPMPNPIDERRPPKERLLGIPAGESGGTAFPFGELESEDGARVIAHTQEDTRMAVFWDGDARAAMAYRPEIGGELAEFEVRDGSIVDLETESTWSVEGRATDGPRAGAQLPPIGRAYVAWWFAWAAFQPETKIWTA